MKEFFLFCMRATIWLPLLLFCGIAQAGIVELGATINYRNSKFNAGNYQQNISYTGSISYYFLEQSALEFSITSGQAKLSTQPTGDPQIIYITQYSMIGLDLVFSFTKKGAIFAPYVKAGGAQIKKEIFRELENGEITRIDDQKGLVPSAGIGFKLTLTKFLRLKFGVDAWTSPQDDDDPVTVDYAGRAGISWLF